MAHKVKKHLMNILIVLHLSCKKENCLELYNVPNNYIADSYNLII